MSGSATTSLASAAPHLRTELGVETVIAFAPERLFDYLRFERTAQSLHLEPAAALSPAPPKTQPSLPPPWESTRSSRSFALTGEGDPRHHPRAAPAWARAVRGGVAERHLHKGAQRKTPMSPRPNSAPRTGPPDFFVRLKSGTRVTVECKNASPVTYADGTPKVETQKTRASKGDPKSRLYDPAQFRRRRRMHVRNPQGVGSSATSGQPALARATRTYPDRIAPNPANRRDVGGNARTSPRLIARSTLGRKGGAGVAASARARSAS